MRTPHANRAGTLSTSSVRALRGSRGDPACRLFERLGHHGAVYQYYYKNGTLVDTISAGFRSSASASGVAADPGASI